MDNAGYSTDDEKIPENSYEENDERDNKKEHMDFEQLLKHHVGQFGVYQQIVVFFAMFFHLFGAFNNMGTVFVAGTPDHWCATPDLDHLNLTQEVRKNLTIPVENGVYAECKMFSQNYSGWTSSDVYACLSTKCNNETNIVPCAFGMVYSKEQYLSSVVSEFNLVCNRQFLDSLQESIYMVGLLFGVFASGVFSDRYGRFPVSIVTHILMTITMIGTGLAHNFVLYCILRLACGVFTIANFTTTFILGVEIVGPKYRVVSVMAYGLMWSIGVMIFAGCAYLIRTWTTLQLITSAPCVLLIIAFLFMPESPRWLYARKRSDKANKIMAKIAKMNKTSLPDNFLINIKTKKSGQFWEILSTPNLRKRSLIQFFLWFTVSAGYFMLSLGTSNLAGNNYLNFLISGLVEICATFTYQIALVFFGRRLVTFISFLIGGVALLTTLLLQSYPLIVTVLSMVGKFGISAAFSTLYVFTPELYPTCLRNVGIGTASLFARIGGIISPFVSDVRLYAWWFPNTFIGGLTCIAALSSLLLPETKDKTIPETIEDAERFGISDENKDSLGSLDSRSPDINGTDHYVPESDARI